MARDFSAAFYRSAAWQKVRQYALMRDRFLCVNCGAPAEEVHHIVHLTPENIYDPAVTLNPDNLRSLCRDCHFKEHFKDKADGHRKGNGPEIPEGMDYEFDENGMVVPRSSPKSEDAPVPCAAFQ